MKNGALWTLCLHAVVCVHSLYLLTLLSHVSESVLWVPEARVARKEYKKEIERTTPRPRTLRGTVSRLQDLKDRASSYSYCYISALNIKIQVNGPTTSYYYGVPSLDDTSRLRSVEACAPRTSLFIS